MRRLPALILAALLVSSCTTSVPPNATGEQIYQSLCARCHGADLQGRIGPPLGPGSHAASEPDSYLVTTITRGIGGMPSFSRTLTPAQIDEVVAYIRSNEGK